jgi:N-acetylmuramoyl-L-alanine amidase
MSCYIIVLVIILTLVKFTDRAVTVIVEHSSMEERTCIAIDAGHGGIDGGAVSISGTPESQINLEIAERLNSLFHLLGYETFMLRTSDTSLHTDGTTISGQKISDLKHRVQIVEECAAELLISIHQNTFSDKKYKGAQVFYNNASNSFSLAEHLQKNFIATINQGSNRKAKAVKSIYLMEHVPCPGLLVECGFLTNIQEELQLRSPDYQKELCGVIVATVSTYWK